MTVRFQRLLLILLSLVFLIFIIFLILFNSKKNLIFFYTPTELLNSDIQIDETVRIGGIVQKYSIINQGNNQYNFNIINNKNLLRISFSGLLPDLFKEEQGAVIEGILLKNNVIKASKVFAKHDENYMPDSIKKQLQNNKRWKKQYK